MPPRSKHILGSDSCANTRTSHRTPGIDLSSADRLLFQSKKVPIELLQLLLNVFNDAFTPQSEHNFFELIQQVKQHLFNRDFSSAFGREEFLRAYAIRWSPIRALAYTSILCGIPILAACLSLVPPDNFDSSIATEESLGVFHDSKVKRGRVCRIVCIGAGGGAEIVALGGFLKHLEEISCIQQRTSGNDLPLGQRSPRIHLDVTAIDIAKWDPIISKLHSGITTAPTLSQYASAETKAANHPLVDPSMYMVRFVKQDVLRMELTDLATISANMALVTLMFTLNELYSTSISATTNLLLSLTMLLSPGALLLVVDSPGSYSTVKLGVSSDPNNESGSKKYPMQWLLDHTLLESAAVGSSKNVSDGSNQWEKLESRESEWFRLPKGLVYPIDLEDMRYQVHLYRRL